ncbi:MAG: DUF2946 family protein [Hyphomicrobiaceae bacterium]
MDTVQTKSVKASLAFLITRAKLYIIAGYEVEFLRSCLTYFVVLNLFLRSLLAPGFMLASDEASNGPTIVICTDQGLVLVDLDEDGRPLDKEKKSTSHAKCPYAASTIVALLVPLPSVAFRPAEVSRHSFRPASLQFISRPELPAPARGPPFA